MAGGRTRRGGRERGHTACSAEANDGGRTEGEVGKPLRHARSEQQPQLPRAEAQLPRSPPRHGAASVFLFVPGIIVLQLGCSVCDDQHGV